MEDIPEPPANTRAFYSPKVLRELVKKNVKDAFEKKLNSLETNNFKLKVKDIDYQPKEFSLADQKAAILERKDVTVPLRGTFELIDKKTNNVVDTKSTIIAHVPYITDRNTSILNGSEYINLCQSRLLPGVYTRIRESGEAEAHINVQSGTGMGAHLIFYPEKELFILKIQSTQIPLYGILRDLGVGDSTMQDAWGTEIFKKNKASYSGSELDKLWDKVFNRN